jgi:hypothetical protein
MRSAGRLELGAQVVHPRKRLRQRKDLNPRQTHHWANLSGLFNLLHRVCLYVRIRNRISVTIDTRDNAVRGSSGRNRKREANHHSSNQQRPHGSPGPSASEVAASARH